VKHENREAWCSYIKPLARIMIFYFIFCQMSASKLTFYKLPTPALTHHRIWKGAKKSVNAHRRSQQQIGPMMTANSHAHMDNRLKLNDTSATRAHIPQQYPCNTQPARLLALLFDLFYSTGLPPTEGNLGTPNRGSVR
jgi:hypothetical protein